MVLIYISFAISFILYIYFYDATDAKLVRKWLNKVFIFSWCVAYVLIYLMWKKYSWNARQPSYFEPTVHLRDSYIIVMMSGLIYMIGGRQSCNCGCPPSFARDQNRRTGISGNTKDKGLEFAERFQALYFCN